MIDYYSQINDFLVDEKNVSRETFSKLEQFHDIIVKYNKTINLVSRDEVSTLWQRHILDSIQLINYIPNNKNPMTVTDFGSGGGFPGLILAIIMPQYQFHLVESDKRKSIFLREACMQLQVNNVHVHNERIENIQPWKSDILTARALAPMPLLIKLLADFIEDCHFSLFLKGENVLKEMREASQDWEIDYQLNRSITDPNAHILMIHSAKNKK